MHIRCVYAVARVWRSLSSQPVSSLLCTPGSQTQDSTAHHGLGVRASADNLRLSLTDSVLRPT